MNSFKIIQTKQQEEYDARKRIEEKRLSQAKTLDPMVKKVLKELRKTLDTTYWILDSVGYDAEFPFPQWYLGGFFSLDRLRVVTQYDEDHILVGFQLIHATYRSRSCKADEQSLRDAIIKMYTEHE